MKTSRSSKKMDSTKKKEASSSLGSAFELVFFIFTFESLHVLDNNKFPLSTTLPGVPRVFVRDEDSPVFKADESGECDWP